MKKNKRKIKEFAFEDIFSDKVKLLRYNTDYLVLDKPLHNIREMYQTQRLLAQMIDLSRYYGFQIIPAMVIRKDKKQTKRK